MKKANASESYHFASTYEVPTFSGSTTFEDVYQKLDSKKCGGFVVRHRGGYRSHVDAVGLAQVALKRVADDSAALERLASQPIIEIVEEAIPSPEIVLVTSEPLQAASEEPSRHPHPLVYEVLDRGRRIGWYLNRETVRGTTTRKTVFLCSDEPPHKNSTYNGGQCSWCPRPIVDVEIGGT